MSTKIRLDLHLLTQGFASSRQQAQRIIRAGKVQDVNGQILDKPGHLVVSDLVIRVKASPRFVSRGGEKLLGAFKAFPLNVEGRTCLDCGISTGGFTDCLLQHGASRIYGIDVGYGQLAWKLRQDSRVVLKERTNLRTLSPESFYKHDDQKPDFAVADLSFISLKLVMGSIRALLQEENSEAVFLVKPQFEVGKGKVGKGGVVRDKSAHIDALGAVIFCAGNYNWHLKGLIPSPITGPAGNHEYLVWLGENKGKKVISIDEIVERTLS